MTEAIDFLRALSGLLDDGSAGVEPAELIETARLSLETLRLAEPSADFVLTPGGINWGAHPVENGAAAWMDRLRDEGVAVLAPPNDAIAFDRWVRGLVDQVGTAAATARMSAVAVATSPRATGLVPTPAQARELDVDLEPAPTAEVPQMTSAPVGAVCVQEEADRVRRIHEAAGSGVALSAVDVSAVVETLAGLLDRDALSARVDLVATLDEYTTAHSINTALLSMKLARALGYDDAGLIEIGGAGLLHDVGKVRLGDLPSVSRQMLSPEERGVLQSHTAEGARLLLDSGHAFTTAAVVAYEHHMSPRGEGGYPVRHFDRPIHAFSRMVAVCDVYDVLRSERSFRPALSAAAASKYLGLLAGNGLDPELTDALIDLTRVTVPRVETPLTRPLAEPHEIGWLPETGYDPDCEPRPVRL